MPIISLEGLEEEIRYWVERYRREIGVPKDVEIEVKVTRDVFIPSTKIIISHPECKPKAIILFPTKVEIYDELMDYLKEDPRRLIYYVKGEILHELYHVKDVVELKLGRIIFLNITESTYTELIEFVREYLRGEIDEIELKDELLKAFDECFRDELKSLLYLDMFEMFKILLLEAPTLYNSLRYSMNREPNVLEVEVIEENVDIKCGFEMYFKEWVGPIMMFGPARFRSAGKEEFKDFRKMMLRILVYTLKRVIYKMLDIEDRLVKPRPLNIIYGFIRFEKPNILQGIEDIVKTTIADKRVDMAVKIVNEYINYLAPDWVKPIEITYRKLTEEEGVLAEILKDYLTIVKLPEEVPTPPAQEYIKCGWNSYIMLRKY